MKNRSLYYVFIFFLTSYFGDTHGLIYKKSTRLFIYLPPIVSFLQYLCQKCSIKLKIGTLYHVNNSFQNTAFQIVAVPLKLQSGLKIKLKSIFSMS